MPLIVESASGRDDLELDALLSASDRALMHYGSRYRRFLEQALPGDPSHCLVAKEDGHIVGMLPAFTHSSERFGKVVNSLPFFGSHGGPWVADAVADRSRIALALVAEFSAFVEAQQAAAATVVTNPLDPCDDALRSKFPAQYLDRRIGQIVRLPAPSGSAEHDLDALFAKFHQKTRNAIRKAGKSGFTTSHTDSREALDALAVMHRDSISGLGGIAKPPAVFDAFARTFRYDEDYRLYVAAYGGQIVSALLVLFSFRTAEYFVPATLEEFRNLQPMSLLITEAMAEAVRRGCRLWNWGGTWESQTGVHMFKARWGSEDLPYQYHVSVRSPELLKASRGELLAEYPNFYVLPFSALESAT